MRHSMLRICKVQIRRYSALLTHEKLCTTELGNLCLSYKQARSELRQLDKRQRLRSIPHSSQELRTVTLSLSRSAMHLAHPLVRPLTRINAHRSLATITSEPPRVPQTVI